MADTCRDRLIEVYGEEAGRKVRYAEAFQLCEYGRQPTAEELRELFPVFPQEKKQGTLYSQSTEDLCPALSTGRGSVVLNEVEPSRNTPNP